MMRDSREWKIGRRGEILSTGIWARGGYSVLDVSASANHGAPLLHEASVNIVSPDHLLMRVHTFFMDTKTKETVFDWKGGTRGGEGQMPAGPAHGIDTRSFLAYREVAKRRPVVLSVLCIRAAVLLAGELTALGEPWPSVSAEHDLVNWPVKLFKVIQPCHPERLHRYFYHADGTVRDPPERMPSADALRAMVQWVCSPAQSEIEDFRTDLMARLDEEWGR